MSTDTKEVVVVIGPGSIGQAIARRVGAGRTLLLAAHSAEATEAAAGQLRGDGFEVASMAGHRESPYEREIEHALATTETSQLLALAFLQPEQVGSSVHAYALAKRANSLRVLTAAAAWGKRGARVNAVSPGVPPGPAGRIHHRG